VQGVVKNKSRELETLKRDMTKLENIKPPFPRISYEDAIDVLVKAGNAGQVRRRFWRGRRRNAHFEELR